jgi:uroporphyrin-III C-methyltransferase
LQRLQAADIVLADALIDSAFQSLAPQAQWVNVGKRGFCRSTPQDRINALLVEAAQSHARVVRLKGGDPSLFGRLEEELLALQACSVPFEVVPGVTAALAAAADAGQPLTRRGRGRHVVLQTAVSHEALEARTTSGPARPDTQVFYMAGRQMPALARSLRQAGWPAETAVVVTSRAGCADSIASRHTLATLESASVRHAGRPAVITLGVGAECLATYNSASVPEPPTLALRPDVGALNADTCTAALLSD